MTSQDQKSAAHVAKWLRALEWDGKSRLPQFFATLTFDQRIFDWRHCFIQWFQRAIYAALTEQPIEEHLVIIGPQGCGKSTWINKLPRFFPVVEMQTIAEIPLGENIGVYITGTQQDADIDLEQVWAEFVAFAFFTGEFIHDEKWYDAHSESMSIIRELAAQD
jgi:ATPase subunit of ABC transporter with duplicated ATPase domains